MGRGPSVTFAIFLIITSSFLIPNTTLGQTDITTGTEIPIFFNFTLLVPLSGDFGRQEATNAISQELRKIGINTEVKFLYIDFITPRIWENWEDPVPIYNESSGFDAYIVNWEDHYSSKLNDFGYLTSFPLATFDKNYINFRKDWDLINPNYHNYFNDSYVNLINEYYREFNLSKRLGIFKQAQQILYDDLPFIGIYNRYGTSMVNKNWGLSEKEISAINIQSTPSLLADLKFGSKKNITIYTDSFRDFNPLAEVSRLQQFVYQPLYENDIDIKTKWIPLIAESLPTWNENRTEATIKIRDDVFFADGVQLNATDVKESFIWYLELFANPFRERTLDQFYEATRYINNSESIEIIDPFTIKIKLTEPYIFDMNLFSRVILPYHIYGSATNQAWFDINSVIFDDLLANSTSQYGFGTGPYTYGGINYDASSYYLTLNKNPNYWAGDVQTDNIIITKFNPKLLPQKISQGEIDLGFDDFADRTLTDPSVEGLDNLQTYKYDWPFQQWFGFNMIHPIFGTGKGTPLGLENQDNPGIAEKAARYVRKAINHAIPRPLLKNEIYANQPFNFGPLPFGQNFIGFNTDLDTYEYNLTRSMEFMKLAGYKYTNNSSTPEIKNTDSTSTDGLLAIQNELIGFAIIVILTLKMSVRHRKMNSWYARYVNTKRELIK